MFSICNDYILVSPIKTDETTDGGIVLPDIAKERPKSGIVILSNDNNYPTGCKIWYSSYAPEELNLKLIDKTEIYHILKIKDIYLKEEDDD